MRNFKELNTQLIKLMEGLHFSYTEEPDAFETYDQIIMQKELEDRINKEYKQQEQTSFYKKRNGILNRVLIFLGKLSGVRDIQISQGKVPYITCYIPEYQFNRFSDWLNKQNNVLDKGSLKLDGYNASRGYTVIVY